MNVVDSSGWIEFFNDGPNASFFAGAIEAVDQLIVPSLSLLEVYRFVLRGAGRDPALEVAAVMRQGRVIDLDESIALDAAELSVHHRLPLADSVIYATARSKDAVLWTQDSDFEGLEDVEYCPSQPA